MYSDGKGESQLRGGSAVARLNLVGQGSKIGLVRLSRFEACES